MCSVLGLVRSACCGVNRISMGTILVFVYGVSRSRKALSAASALVERFDVATDNVKHVRHSPGAMAASTNRRGVPGICCPCAHSASPGKISSVITGWGSAKQGVMAMMGRPSGKMYLVRVMVPPVGGSSDLGYSRLRAIYGMFEVAVWSGWVDLYP
jgi:hypothetical protein